MFAAKQLDHVAFHVHDLARSISWYHDILGLEERERYRDTTGYGRPTVLCSGSGCLALFPTGRDENVTPLHGHIAFRLNRENFDQARDDLRHTDIDVKYVEYLTVHSLYFHDPDGYEIELSTWDI